MAELKLSDLPVMTEADFTNNDRFVVVDDGKARAMTKAVFQSWLSANVKGERGEQGVAGNDGRNGTNGIKGANGNDGLSAYQVAVQNGFVGTQPQWIASLKGDKGVDGNIGSNGWSPNFKIVARGNDSVLHLFEWIGGTGTKPTTTGYLSGTGIVSNILNATNIRGLRGIQGVKGEKGASGDSAIKIRSVSYNDDLSILVTNTDASTITSSLPPKKQGWGTYKDSQYTDTSPMRIAVTTERVLPNNATVKLENLPTGNTEFYDPVLQKYMLSDSDGYYNVCVRFKVIASETTGTINLSMSKATTDTPFSEDKTLRGDNKVQEVVFNAMIYGDEALSSNGLTIRLKTFEREIRIYNIEVTVAKIM